MGGGAIGGIVRMKLRIRSVENNSSKSLFLSIFKFHIGSIARALDPGNSTTVLLNDASAKQQVGNKRFRKDKAAQSKERT